MLRLPGLNPPTSFRLKKKGLFRMAIVYIPSHDKTKKISRVNSSVIKSSRNSKIQLQNAWAKAHCNLLGFSKEVHFRKAN